MNQISLEQELKSNSYLRRGTVIGRSDDGAKAVTTYFIMGRSVNSRNRVLVVDGGRTRIQAFDPAKLGDPSLITYASVWVLESKTIVTNGDQTDTTYDRMDHQMTSEQFLRCRESEPDTSNYTLRISGTLHIENGNYNYIMSILKSDNTNSDSYLRPTYVYQSSAAGEERFVHTYVRDGSPPPSSEGEPRKVGISGDIDAFTDLTWNSLNEDSKVSLFARYIDIAAGTYEIRIANKNE